MNFQECKLFMIINYLHRPDKLLKGSLRMHTITGVGLAHPLTSSSVRASCLVRARGERLAFRVDRHAKVAVAVVVHKRKIL